MPLLKRSRAVGFNFLTRGSLRGLNTGAEYSPDKTDANADLAGGSEPLPRDPLDVGLPSATGLPWYDALEDPFAETGLFQTQNPTYPNPDVGARPIAGAYEAAFKTRGPVAAFGHEVSGGPQGDQALGRVMRFPVNIPQRYAANGVSDNQFADELAAAIARGNYKPPTSAQINESLLMGT